MINKKADIKIISKHNVLYIFVTKFENIQIQAKKKDLDGMYYLNKDD